MLLDPAFFHSTSRDPHPVTKELSKKARNSSLKKDQEDEVRQTSPASPLLFKQRPVLNRKVLGVDRTSVSDADSNSQTGSLSGSVFGIWIQILKVKLSYKNPLFPQIFNDFHLFLKMIPNKSSLFNKIPP